MAGQGRCLGMRARSGPLRQRARSRQGQRQQQRQRGRRGRGKLRVRKPTPTPGCGMQQVTCTPVSPAKHVSGLLPAMPDNMARTAPVQGLAGPRQGAVRASALRKRDAALPLSALFDLAVLMVLVAVGANELATSRLQAHYLARLGHEVGFELGPGESPNVRFPEPGPYDLRFGYARLPELLTALGRHDTAIEAQARWSPRLEQLERMQIFPPYQEKDQAGLQIFDRDARTLYSSRWPERTYPGFADIPEEVVQMLLFIENRTLLDGQRQQVNPAVEWGRLLYALGCAGLRSLGVRHNTPGASTLATQIEKFRHSPGGLTRTPLDKLRQMASASIRAYLEGPDTLPARKRIVLSYVNSLPLGAVPGYGEVLGLGDGLWAWFGEDFTDVNATLQDREARGAVPTASLADAAATEQNMRADRRAQALKEVLALFLAQRRPAWFRGEGRAALTRLTDSYTRLLAGAGIVPPDVAERMLHAPLELSEQARPQLEGRVADRKAADAVRTQLLQDLGLDSLYDLDRLDLTVQSTIDLPVQQAVSEALRSLQDPKVAAKAGLLQGGMLAVGDPGEVVYSFNLYERVAGANVLRVQTDTFDGPFNLNDGMKLELGSTAKLRTLVTYLELCAELYQRYATLSVEELTDRAQHGPGDRLTRWVLDWLLGRGPEEGLPELLEAAMQRRYSADPDETFFTGGGVHRFTNFNGKYDQDAPTVRKALQQSINLVFVRLMRDIVQHFVARIPGADGELFAEEPGGDPQQRAAYLWRYVDRESEVFLERFIGRYAGLTTEQAFARLVGRLHPLPHRLAVAYRHVFPEHDLPRFAAFLRSQPATARLTDERIAELYAKYAPGSFNLQDQGYIAKVHPLELWTVGYLRHHPAASRAELVRASAAARRAVYSWLFKTTRRKAQDKRIRIELEREAFREIHRRWQRLGYPFAELTPSFATALGSSGDRPKALADLVGILQNGGIRYPLRRVERLHFAAGTPYETIVRRQPQAGERVLLSEVAAAARQELAGVVEHGTAARLDGVFVLSDGTELEVGGKTGTGDNRRDSYGAGGRVAASQVVSRTGTFVFFIGDRWFGVITAFVSGKQAARYRFTSLLPVRVLELLAPKLTPVLEAPRSLLPAEDMPPLAGR